MAICILSMTMLSQILQKCLPLLLLLLLTTTVSITTVTAITKQKLILMVIGGEQVAIQMLPIHIDMAVRRLQLGKYTL